MWRILCILLLVLSSAVFAKTVQLETGHCWVDKTRTVELDKFDYVYSVKQIHLTGLIIELNDGSIWRVEASTPESRSFYSQRDPSVQFEWVGDLLKCWKSGELLIFHKVSNRQSLLLYNLEKDLILDVIPMQAPHAPPLTIEWIDSDKRQLKLSDDSVWSFEVLREGWEPNHPIVVAKNTPWRGHQTHVLINLSPCDEMHIHPNRLGVNRLR